MSKVAEPAQAASLQEEVERLEQKFDIPVGSTELVPNVESARGIMQTYAIATVSWRVTGVLGSTEDVAADLGAPRSKEATELVYARQRSTSNVQRPMFSPSTALIRLPMSAAAKPMRVMRGSSAMSPRAWSIATMSRPSIGL
jgi:citrate lyase beta subunit